MIFVYLNIVKCSDGFLGMAWFFQPKAQLGFSKVGSSGCLKTECALGFCWERNWSFPYLAFVLVSLESRLWKAGGKWLFSSPPLSFFFKSLPWFILSESKSRKSLLSVGCLSNSFSETSEEKASFFRERKKKNESFFQLVSYSFFFSLEPGPSFVNKRKAEGEKK